MANACARSRPPLDDANEIRLDAIVELTAPHATSAICFSVDPRSGPYGSPIVQEPFAHLRDPEPELFQAVSRIGPAYPGSRCVRADSIVHPGGSDRRGAFVSLGAVNLSPDGHRGALLAHVSVGFMSGELRRLTYRREGTGWRASSNILVSQE